MKRLVLRIKAIAIIVLIVCIQSICSPVYSKTLHFSNWIESNIDPHWTRDRPFQNINSKNYLPQESSHAHGLLEEGKTLLATGRFAAAVGAWQQAAIRFSEIGDRLNQARSLSYLAVAYFQLDQLEDAEDAIDRALIWLLQNPSVAAAPIQLLAQTLNTRGNIQLALGKPEAALSTWQQAEQEYGRIGDEIGKLGSQIDRARALQQLGLYPRSRTLLQQVLSQLQDQSDSSLKATGFRMLGDAMGAMGDWEESRQLLDHSVELGQHLAATDPLKKEDLSATLLSLGNTLRALHDTEAAIETYQQAAETATSSRLQVQAQLNQLSLLIDTETGTQIHILVDGIRSKLEQLPPTRASIYARVNLTESLLRMSTDRGWIPENETIAQLLAIAVQQARELEDRTAESYAVGTLGKLYEHSGQWQEAQQLTEMALAISESLHAPEISIRWQWQLGRLLRQQGQTEAAIAMYRDAVQTVQSLRRDWVGLNADVQFSLTEEIEPLYREAISLLLDANPSQTRLKQAQDTIAALGRAELENFFQEACWQGDSQPMDEIDDRAAVFYPIVLPAVGEERLAVIVSFPKAPLFYYETRHPPGEIAATIEQFKLYLNPVFFNEDRQTVAEKLYDWLIRPAQNQLPEGDIRTLVFVLDSILQNVPIAALFDGDRYLIEQYSIAVTPGARLLDPHPLTAERIDVFLGGLSQGNQGFPGLPAVTEEIRRIADFFPSLVLLDRAFTLDRLREAIARIPFSVVHLATHGQFSSQAANTFLLTWNGRIRVKDLDLLLQPRGFDQPIELLVLSACQTAMGDKRAALGLAGIALRSGARSTLGTLWQVSDASTTELMVQFYQQFTRQPGVSKAEALRSAQLFLLQQPEFRHPFFWSPYILVGNWL
jgi:CHAT domain-containing protein